MEAPPSRAEQARESFKLPDAGRVRQFFTNEFKRIFLFCLVTALCTWAFVYKWQEYNFGAKFELMGYTLPLAKGCAEIMKVSVLFLMIFMCRGFITLWRGSWTGKYLIEFDDAVMIHICCAKLFGV